MDKITSSIEAAISDLFDESVDVRLAVPDDISHGDFSTNVAMQLAKKLGKNPREVAEQIVDKLGYDAEVAGPGFINIKLDSKNLYQILDKQWGEGYGGSDNYIDQVVVTEYSDPNPFKVLHVGHLYTSIVGDAISNLVEQAGGIVHRVNFGGDVGLHVGKTMWGIIQDLGGELPEKLADIAEDDRSEWMARCYVEGTRAYEDDEAAKAQIIDYNKQIYQLHAEDIHDTPFAQIYWTCRTWSYDYFDAFYARIGTKFEKYYPESTVAPLGLATVLEQKGRGIYRESNGAVIFDGEPYGLHTRVFINSNGLPTYEAKDVGLSITKWNDYHFDKSIIITGNDILDYMKTVVKSIEQFAPEPALRTQHITHGNVKLSGGVKMSSRKGNFLRAVDVLDITTEANKVAQGAADPVVVLGAIKFAFLKVGVGPDIIFDPKTSVSLQGNSGPYVQYATVRIKKILATNRDFERVDFSSYDFEAEKPILKLLLEYPDIVRHSANLLEPHRIAFFAHNLAKNLNQYYEKNPVSSSDNITRSARLDVLGKVAQVMTHALSILGLEVPSKM